MRMMFVAAMLFILSACAGPKCAREANDPTAEVQVREVLERFRAAIAAKDGKTLRGLFLPQPSAWISVVGDASYPRLLASKPNAKRVRADTYDAFARSVEYNPKREEELFSNIDVRTDGAVAAVSFDFVYSVDGQPTNRGIEAWQLAKTDDGWKIVSMIYSVNLPRLRADDERPVR